MLETGGGVYVGIDPGKSGAICAINGNKEVVAMLDMPLKANPNKKEKEREKIDTAKVLTLLFQIAQDFGGIRYAALERPHAIFGKATKSAMFSLGVSFGILEAALYNAQAQVVATPTPSSWKKKVGASSDKEASVALASSSLSNLNLLKSARCKVPSHDRAEAALLALYALNCSLQVS